MRVAECTVWTEGAFRLSKTTIAELMRHLHNSDFGIFVFAPDDSAEIRKVVLSIPRDNVVYEAGLFSGHLGPERCFIVTPLTQKIGIPSDLLGMTLGSYEDNRTDNNYDAAVGSFCDQVETAITQQGLFDRHLDAPLRELAVQFESCDFSPDGTDPSDPSKQRVARKKRSQGRWRITSRPIP
jgi:predicted nucleotide-binding protein